MPSKSGATDLSQSAADKAAIAKCLEEHRAKLYAMLQRRLDPAISSRLDPEDILHDAFLKAYRKWPQPTQSRMTPYTWLYGIVLDCLKEAWRRETRRKRDVRRQMPWPERSSVQLGLSLISPGSSPSKKVQRSELEKRVREAMSSLAQKDQEILWMRHFDGLSHKESGMILGISTTATNVRYFRALKRFKEIWNSQLCEEE